MMMMRKWITAVLLICCLPLQMSCFEESPVVPKVTSESFELRESVEQLHLWNAEPEIGIEVLAPDGRIVREANTDYQGSLIFRELKPGSGYTVRLADNRADFTDKLTVMPIKGSLPEASFYEEQVLVEGFQYLTMRDGTKLSAWVWMPGPPEDGPYPTIVNYSGYSPSQPGKSMGADLEIFCGEFPVICNAPSHPAGLLAGLKGYASVGVNMRGTGCSGGAYDYFEPLQLLDGYDVIEIVSRQSWVKFNKVGMAGLSYPGISQLFVAKTRPPGLAAISPMSVIADTASSCLAPGGIYNNGFALSWIEHVVNRADPYGHGWIRDLVDEGDTVCEEHQLLHSQKLDVVSKALDNPFYSDEVAGPVDPTRWVDQIDVPVYLSGQWQDEQTGPHFAILFDMFDNAPVTHFAATNGVHADGYFNPQLLVEWMTFLDLYVAHEVPRISSGLRGLAGMMFQEMSGAYLELPQNRFQDYTSYDQAKADYEAEDPVLIIFESGVQPGNKAGAPLGTFDQRFAGWPIPGTVATRWYLQPDGSLGDAPPGAASGGSAFVHEPEAGERVTLAPGSSVDHLQPEYTYRQLVPGKAMAFESTPLDQTLVMIGSGSVDLWVRSTADDADLEVNLTEVRPDGLEQLVQSGWLRASHRTLRESEATELRPVKTHYEEDAKPLVAGEWNELRIEIMPFTHIFRAGSRIRLSVDTPGDSRAWWHYILLDHGDTQPTHSVAHHAAHPSSVVLPVVPGVVVPTELHECRALRGQPCRDYVEYENTPLP